MELIEMELINSINNANMLVIRLLLNMAATGFIIFVLYYRRTHRKDYMITFSLISLTVFLLVFLLDGVKLQLGFALGLFAIFGIIRYRTIVIPTKEMTYLFVLIGVSIINALTDVKERYIEIFLTNVLLIFICWFIESEFFESKLIKKRINTKVVIYDNIKLIRAGMEAELKKDLEDRLGISIVKIEIENVDLVKDCAMLYVSYILESDKIISLENCW